MQEEFARLSSEEELRVENDIMKMKLMLENGAEFHSNTDSELDPRIENDFLHYIAEFERQSENPVYIRVFDKIGQPDQFKMVADIPDEEMDAAWKSLSDYLHQHQISVDVCSPNITSRELYRFVTEELFEYKMDDMNIPGMMTGFIYDEFHPDPVYDNTRTAIEDCIHYILEKQPMEWLYNFFDEGLRLNEHVSLTAEEFRTRVNRFKDAYSTLTVNSVDLVECVVNESESKVSGRYSVLAEQEAETKLFSGSWRVFFEVNPEHGNWDIIAVDIEGISF